MGPPQDLQRMGSYGSFVSLVVPEAELKRSSSVLDMVSLVIRCGWIHDLPDDAQKELQAREREEKRGQDLLFVLCWRMPRSIKESPGFATWSSAQSTAVLVNTLFASTTTKTRDPQLPLCATAIFVPIISS